MSLYEKANVASKIERIVDFHGWNGLIDGIDCLVKEYYFGDDTLITGVSHSLAKLRLALAVHCPDAPGSHERSAEDAG